MLLLPTPTFLVLWLTILALPVTSQYCKLIKRSDQQPLGPSIPSPSISPITNTTGGASPTGTSSSQPTSTPFVYGRDKIRGVNLCAVLRFHPSLIFSHPF